MKYKMKAIVGMPGSGKSTIGNLLGQLPEFVTMDFGKIVRSLSVSSDLWKNLNNFIKNGDPFPPEENLKLLNYILFNFEKEKIFDPMSQTIISCGNFGKAENVSIFKEYFIINQVFVLEVDEDVARKRLFSQITQQKRHDGNSDIIDKRISNYKQSISQILEQFDNNIIYSINANNKIEKVFNDITKGIETIESNVKYDIRRIFLENEAKEIKFLQNNASEFTKHYPKHSQWLEKAVKEIVTGSRIAFGVYRTESNDELLRVELVGSIILKFDLYTNIARMKNLFIKADSRGKGNGTKFCEIVEYYCAKQGYSEIMTEVPGNEYDTIKFLLKRNYKIRTINDSPYNVKEQTYEISKNLTPRYGEDFFDLFNMAKWLLKVVYNFKNIKGNDENNTITFDLDLMVDSSDLGLMGESIYSVEGIVPNGFAVVLDKDNIKCNEIVNIISNGKIKYNLVFVFGRTFEAETIKKCRNSGILVFDYFEITQKFKELFAYVLPEFRKEEIEGLIVSVNPENFDKIERRNSIFTYFKAGSIGKYLQRNNIIIFYSEPSQKYPEAGIKGYGDIIEVFHGDPVKTWNKFKGENPIFTHEQYQSYAKNKKSMLGLKVDNFKSFRPLSLEDLRKTFDDFASIDDLYNNYVSKTIVDRFNKVVNRNPNIESEQEDSKVSIPPKLREIFVSKREKNVIRIATIQIDYELSSSFPFEIKNKNETYSKIYLALEKAKEKNCDIICFPELSFCEEWLPEIKDKFSSMIIIAGSHYNNNKNNICQIFFGPDNFTSSQLKIKPSASEKEIYAKRMVPGESVNIYESKFGTFAVLICRDFPHYVRYLRNKVDIIFVPSYNKELENFYSAAQDHVIHSPSYVIISNSSQYGGTSLFGIEDHRIFDQLVEAGYKSKNDNTYNLCEFKKEKEDIIIEGMIIADLNLVHKTLQKPTPVNPQDEIKPVTIIDKIYF